MKTFLNLILLGILIFLSPFFVFSKSVKAQQADHLVISEVQISGGPGKTTNDFIEIYNPTESVINLSGYKLRKRTQSGSESSIKVFTDGQSIFGHGFFLWANSNDGYDQTIAADASSTQTIADNNSIALFNGDDVLLDVLAWGSGHLNPFFEGNATSTPANPEPNQSLERKPGGNDGNGKDTDSNVDDFIVQTNPNPQNSLNSPLPPIAGPICGNNLCENGEDQQSCPLDCPAQPNPVCGNNLREIGEDCDGSNLNQKTCLILGWAGGSLKCQSNCLFDTSVCLVGGGGGNNQTFNSSDIVINELVVDPVDDEKEWIELYNNTNQEIDLTNWLLEDGTETRTNLSGKILGNGFVVVENLKFSLNNAGDIVILRSPSGSSIDQVTYGNWNDGNLHDNAPLAPDPNSLARVSDGADSQNDLIDFQATKTKTKGKSNQISENIELVKEAVMLNEILPNPVGDDQAGEFIELKNIGEQKINLNNWQLEDASGAKYILNNQDLNIIDIEAKGFFVLKREKTGIALNNIGFESLKLYNAAGQLVSSLNYEGPAQENQALACDEDLNWQWTNQPTPGTANIFKENVNIVENKNNFIGKIVISEVFPNPVGSDNSEWLEIYNADQLEINLKNWQLDDEEGGSAIYKIKNDLIIKPGQYLIFPKEETKISFNNSEDSFRLLTPDGKVIEEIYYEDVQEGFSYARENNQWFWTKTVTPGAKNIILEASEEILENKNLSDDQPIAIELSNLRQLEVGTKVKVNGVVSVGPGILGSQIFYLAGSGVQVYCYKKDFPKLKIGDLITVSGELADYRGETRIKITQQADIKIIKKDQVIPIHQLKIDQINENLEGSLVSIEGQLIESSSGYWYIDDGSGEIKVYIKSNTGIEKPKVKEGDWLKIIGVVSQYDDDYRLLPRFQEDIILLGQANLKNDDFNLTGSLAAISQKNIFSQINNLGVLKYFLVSFIFLIAILVGLLIKKKK